VPACADFVMILDISIILGDISHSFPVKNGFCLRKSVGLWAAFESLPYLCQFPKTCNCRLNIGTRKAEVLNSL